MADGQTLSLRDQLAAARDEIVARDETPPAGETATEAQGATGAETGAAEAATPEPATTDEPAEAGERPRGPDGKFLPKDTGPAVEGAQAAAPPADPAPSAAPAGQEAPSEPIRVPPSLPAPLKAKFAGLDPDVQAGFVALEESVQKAKAEWGPKGQRLNRFDEIIGPHADRWRMAGLDEFSGIQSLIAAQSVLDQDPVRGLREIARSYNLSAAHIAQAFGLTQTSAPTPGQEGQPTPTAAPDFERVLQPILAPMVQQVQTLQQQLNQSRQADEAAKIAQAQREIDAFTADPANMYFDNVADAVGAIIAQDRQAGGSMSLKEAYERAIWADPTIRPLLLDGQAKAAAAEDARKASEAKAAAEKAAREKAQAASKAAGSVTGSPTPGASPPQGASRNLRAELQAAYEAQQL